MLFKMWDRCMSVGVRWGGRGGMSHKWRAEMATPDTSARRKRALYVLPEEMWVYIMQFTDIQGLRVMAQVSSGKNFALHLYTVLTCAWRFVPHIDASSTKVESVSNSESRVRKGGCRATSCQPRNQPPICAPEDLRHPHHNTGKAFSGTDND